jgi:two-component system, OmpR family, response regulator
MDTPAKILIVEDDPFTRDLYEEVLRQEGFGVETAIDGEAGLIKLQEGGWRAVLLDIMMPKMDGLQVLKELAAKPPLVPNGPIIVLTNLAQDPIVNEALANGAKTYFLKSELNPDELVAKVKSYL